MPSTTASLAATTMLVNYNLICSTRETQWNMTSKYAPRSPRETSPRSPGSALARDLFGRMALISLGVAALSFLVGVIIRIWLGIEI